MFIRLTSSSYVSKNKQYKIIKSAYSSPNMIDKICWILYFKGGNIGEFETLRDAKAFASSDNIRRYG